MLKLQEPVSSDEGKEMAQRINAYAYLECSAKFNEGVKEVFETATRAALEIKSPSSVWFCTLL